MDALNHEQSQLLLKKLATQCVTENGFGYMAPSIYDSAWLSMVCKQTDENSEIWLFPNCFNFVLENQLPSGGWEAYASPVDGILNTAAALLALKKRIKLCSANAELLSRSQKAEEALRQMLLDWDINSSDQVGFEILVTQHLSLLDEEGVSLHLPHLEELRALRDTKLAKLPPSSVYKAPSTLYHSLEALIGHIDFDQVRRWKESNGSMMSSPSSTAAYLMYASSWDDEAEAYLRSAVEHGSGKGKGGVPCAWPTTVFELTWAVNTLIEAGAVMDNEDSARIGDFLEASLNAQDGVLGFASKSLPDADDTAQGIITLCHLGRTVSPNGLIRTFDAGDHFRTYPGERNPSFSANCNVLVCFLNLPDPEQYLSQIAKTITYLTAQAFSGQINEKWHIKDQYWMMLLTKAFGLLSDDHALLCKLFEQCPKLREDIPIVTLHILLRLLRTQEASGAWENICEVTAYAILALSSLARLPWIRQPDTDVIAASIARGKSFLDAQRSEWRRGHYLWIEKVTYSSDLLSEVYCLAAAMVPSPSGSHPAIADVFRPPTAAVQSMQKLGSLIARTPLFNSTEAYILRIAESQACYALSALKTRAPRIFPRSAKGEDKYLALIPLAFTASAAVCGSVASPAVLYEMMVLSLFNFLADEFMEGVVEKDFGSNLSAIKAIIENIFMDLSPQFLDNRPHDISLSTKVATDQQTTPEIPSNVLVPPTNGSCAQVSTPPTLTLEDVDSVLRLFASTILQHSSVVSSAKELQTRLAFELQAFLLAHVTHAEDNYRFQLQGIPASNNGVENGGGKAEVKTLEFRTPGRTFYNWVRSTSADHTSCPFSYIFFHCLISSSSSSSSSPSGRGVNVFSSPRTAYLAEDLCRHLASLCRIHNDVGSMTRDMDEGNLNSLNFPEFHLLSFIKRGEVFQGKKAQHEVLWIAEYERKALSTALSLLEEELGSAQRDILDALRLYVTVTELYGQIYMMKDVGTRTK